MPREPSRWYHYAVILDAGRPPRYFSLNGFDQRWRVDHQELDDSALWWISD